MTVELKIQRNEVRTMNHNFVYLKQYDIYRCAHCTKRLDKNHKHFQLIFNDSCNRAPKPNRVSTYKKQLLERKLSSS